MRILLLVIAVSISQIVSASLANDRDHLKKLLKPETEPRKLRDYEKAVKSLIGRVTDNVHTLDDFVVEIDPSRIGNDLDTFSLEMIDDNSKLKITANSPVAAAWGFNYYLKYFANSSVYWSGKNINLDAGPLPIVDEKTTVI